MTWTASGRQNGQTAAGMGFLVQILESRRNIVNSLGISMLRQLKSGQVHERSGHCFCQIQEITSTCTQRQKL